MPKMFLLTLVVTLLTSCTPMGGPAQLHRSQAADHSYTSSPAETTPIARTSRAETDSSSEFEYRTTSPINNTIKESKLPDLTHATPAKVALLAPLSGDSADLGKALWDSAQLALFDIGSPNLSLVPIDTKGTPEGAKEAMQKAVQQHVQLVLGPLFSAEAKAVAPIANDNDINVISFSNDSSLIRDDVLLLGFMPEQQVERITAYAYRQGIRDFSALVPDNTFGAVTADEFVSVLRGKFLRVKHLFKYATNDTDSLSTGIQAIGGEPLSKDELKAAENEVDPAPPIENNNPPAAVLVPEGGRVASNIASRLFRHGMQTQHIRLLGSGQWDDNSIPDQRKLRGSWFASSPPELREIFEKHFKKTYSYVPVRIASLAYDGVALAAYLTAENDFSKSAITNRRGYSGVNGVFRIRSNGMSERALAVLEVTAKGFKVIDPAPTDFNSFR